MCICWGADCFGWGGAYEMNFVITSVKMASEAEKEK